MHDYSIHLTQIHWRQFYKPYSIFIQRPKNFFQTKNEKNPNWDPLVEYSFLTPVKR